MNPETDKHTEIIKLSQNENAFGPSPLAIKAIKEHIHSVFRYPDTLHEELKQKLADRHTVKPENIIVTAGSVALMDMSIKCFVGFDENIVIPEITFPGYKVMAGANKRNCRFAELEEYAISLDNLRSRCDEKTRIIFIANPNNPTSTMLKHDDMEKFLETISPDIIVVSDEAYAEYIMDDDYPDSMKLQKKFPNLIIFRTFSKIYGLAGLRIGYAIAHPEMIQALAKYKTPFSVSNLAAVAALAALDDTQYINKCAAVNAEERKYLYTELKNLGFDVVFPHGNFVFIGFNSSADKNELHSRLENEGILTRPLDHFGTERGLRISVGRPEENRHVIRCLT